jgi:hypothetical protein
MRIRRDYYAGQGIAVSEGVWVDRSLKRHRVQETNPFEAPATGTTFVALDVLKMRTSTIGGSLVRAYQAVAFDAPQVWPRVYSARHIYGFRLPPIANPRLASISVGHG